MDASTAFPTSAFERKKAKIMEQLATADTQYTDLSPKGTVDEQIRWLVEGINKQDGFATTSSCAGRISVFLEGKRKPKTVAAEEDTEEVAVHEARNENLAGAGGKGSGGRWLHVSHDPIPIPVGDGLEEALHFTKLFEIYTDNFPPLPSHSEETRYVHFKFEPMILHILTSSPSSAQAVLKAALGAGFRESGAINITPTKTADGSTIMPMVAVRSTGLTLDSIIGILGQDGKVYSLVVERYLQELVLIANQRFEENGRRIDKFASGLGILKNQTTEVPLTNTPAKKVWENIDTRRARKKEEGLKKRQALKEARAGGRVDDGSQAP